MALKWRALDEAIKIIKDNLLPAPQPYGTALKLGIEALERENLRRQQLVELDMAKDIKLLPSETEEDK